MNTFRREGQQPGTTGTFKPLQLSLAEIEVLRLIYAEPVLRSSGRGILRRTSGRIKMTAMRKLHLLGVSLEAHVARIPQHRQLSARPRQCLRSNCDFGNKVEMLEQLFHLFPAEQKHVFARFCSTINGMPETYDQVALETGYTKQIVERFVNNCKERLAENGINSAMFVHHFLSNCAARSVVPFVINAGQVSGENSVAVGSREQAVEQPQEVVDKERRTFSGIKVTDIPHDSKLTRHQFECLRARYDTETGEVLTTTMMAKQLGLTHRAVDSRMEQVGKRLTKMGLARWNYVSACVSAYVQSKMHNTPMPLSRLPYAAEMMAILDNLSPARLEVVEYYCRPNWEGFPHTVKEIAALMTKEKERTTNRRVIEYHLLQFYESLKAEGVNVWTLLMAVTDGNPELIVKIFKNESPDSTMHTSR